MINTDLINTDKISENHSTLLYADLTYKIRGAIFSVYNELGFGHKENVYQKALAVELESLKIAYGMESNLKVKYKGKNIGNYRPDITVEGKIILELKAVEFMPKTFETQLVNYLKTTGYQLGLLVNFGAPKLYIKRLVWTDYPRKSASNQRESVNNQRKSNKV